MSDVLYNFRVTNRQTFIEFLDLLRQDFLDNQESWENNKMESFLEALSAYASDIQGYYNNTNQNIDADNPSWQTFADIFKGAKIYE